MLIPLYDNMIVEMIEEGERKTESGLYLNPDSNTKQYSTAVVVAVGEGYRLNDGNLRPLTVIVGDTVLFRKMVELEIVEDGKKQYMISEATVIAIKRKE